MNDHATGHAISLASLIGWAAGVLPSVATGLAIVWYGVLLYDRFSTKRRGRGR